VIGRENTNLLFAKICSKYKIIHQTMITPQLNEISKRKNRTLKKMMNVLLLVGRSFLTVNQVLNRVPRAKFNLFHELWKRRKLNFKYFKV